MPVELGSILGGIRLAIALRKFLQGDPLWRSIFRETEIWAGEGSALRPGQPDALLAGIATPTDRSDDAVATPNQFSLGRLLRGREVPSEALWLDALVERCAEIAAAYGDDADAFFLRSEAELRAELSPLAAKLRQASIDDPQSFQRSAYRKLEALEIGPAPALKAWEQESIERFQADLMNLAAGELLERLDTHLQTEQAREGSSEYRAKIHSFRSLCLRNLERFDEAVLAVEDSLALAPSRPEAAANAAIYRAVQGDTQDARKWLQRAREIAPDHPSVKFATCVVALATGEEPPFSVAWGAAESRERALSCHVLALAARGRGRAEEARRFIDEAARHPDVVAARVDRASWELSDLAIMRDDIASGVRDIDRASDLLAELKDLRPVVEIRCPPPTLVSVLVNTALLQSFTEDLVGAADTYLELFDLAASTKADRSLAARNVASIASRFPSALGALLEREPIPVDDDTRADHRLVIEALVERGTAPAAEWRAAWLNDPTGSLAPFVALLDLREPEQVQELIAAALLVPGQSRWFVPALLHLAKIAEPLLVLDVIRDIRTQADLLPEHDAALQRLSADLLSELGRHGEACDVLEGLLDEADTAPRVLIRYVTSLLQADRPSAAAMCAGRALARRDLTAEERTQLLYYRCIGLYRSADLSTFLTEVRAFRADPGREARELERSTADALVRTSGIGAALQFLSDRDDSLGQDPDRQILRGDFLTRFGRPGDAFDEYYLAHQQRPDDREILQRMLTASSEFDDNDPRIAQLETVAVPCFVKLKGEPDWLALGDVPALGAQRIGLDTALGRFLLGKPRGSIGKATLAGTTLEIETILPPQAYPLMRLIDRDFRQMAREGSAIRAVSPEEAVEIMRADRAQLEQSLDYLEAGAPLSPLGGQSRVFATVLDLLGARWILGGPLTPPPYPAPEAPVEVIVDASGLAALVRLRLLDLPAYTGFRFVVPQALVDEIANLVLDSAQKTARPGTRMVLVGDRPVPVRESPQAAQGRFDQLKATQEWLDTRATVAQSADRRSDDPDYLWDMGASTGQAWLLARERGTPVLSVEGAIEQAWGTAAGVERWSPQRFLIELRRRDLLDEDRFCRLTLELAALRIGPVYISYELLGWAVDRWAEGEIEPLQRVGDALSGPARTNDESAVDFVARGVLLVTVSAAAEGVDPAMAIQGLAVRAFDGRPNQLALLRAARDVVVTMAQRLGLSDLGRVAGMILSLVEAVLTD